VGKERVGEFSMTKETIGELLVGIIVGLAATAAWWFASFASMASMALARSGALFVALSYLWLVLIFAALAWVFHKAERWITRNVVVIIGCIAFLLNTTCWVGFRFGWFEIGG
jgi:hypothetical protein